MRGSPNDKCSRRLRSRSLFNWRSGGFAISFDQSHGQMNARNLLLLALTFAAAVGVAAENRGVINDPDGFVNVRAAKSLDAAVIAKVKTGEPFDFECEEEAEWCKVTLRSGKTGWMHRSRIRLHFTEKDLPGPDDLGRGSELGDSTRGQGFDYAAVIRDALRGERKGLERFFAIAKDLDGAAAESHAGAPTAVYHLLGDAKFAAFLRSQPLAYRVMVRNSLATDLTFPDEFTTYVRRHFPGTTKALFQREITDWPSPDGRYAVRKIFSDEFDLTESKVAKAEVIDKESGRALCDLTRDDIGIGPNREGDVVWSPDSKRFAYVSSDLRLPEGNLFSTPRPPPQRKQTVVYQLSGESFARIETAWSEVPARSEDTELEGAILGHDYVEPLRWLKPDVLLLEKHEYFEKLKPIDVGGAKFESIHGLGRLHHITATFGADGKATVAWELQKDPP